MNRCAIAIQECKQINAIGTSWKSWWNVCWLKNIDHFWTHDETSKHSSIKSNHSSGNFQETVKLKEVLSSLLLVKCNYFFVVSDQRCIHRPYMRHIAFAFRISNRFATRAFVLLKQNSLTKKCESIQVFIWGSSCWFQSFFTGCHSFSIDPTSNRRKFKTIPRNAKTLSELALLYSNI